MFTNRCLVKVQIIMTLIMHNQYTIILEVISNWAEGDVL